MKKLVIQVFLVAISCCLWRQCRGQDGHVFLSRSQERFASYQVDSTTNWTVSTEGSLVIRFRTSWKDGLLVYARGTNGKFQLWLQDGMLRGAYSLNGATQFSFKQGTRLNTDTPNQILLSKNANKVTVFVSNTIRTYGPTDYAHSLAWDLDSAVYLGGLPASYRPELQFPTEQFVGCIDKVQLSNTQLPTSATVLDTRGVVAGNCTTFNLCDNNMVNNCFSSSQCRNGWFNITCNCAVDLRSDKYGPTCSEEDFDLHTFQSSQYQCTDVNLLTEPAFKEFEVITFVLGDYFIEEPRAVLHLTSPGNPIVSLSVIGQYNVVGSERPFYVLVVLPDGRKVETDPVFFFTHITVTRSVGSVSITNGINTMTVRGIDALDDIEFSRVCVGGGSFDFPGPHEGTIKGLFINGQHLLGTDTMYETVEIDSKSAKFGPLGSSITVDSCTGSDPVEIQLSLQTFSSDANILQIPEAGGSDVILKLTDGKLNLTVGGKVIMPLSPPPYPRINDGISHNVLMSVVGGEVFVGSGGVGFIAPASGSFCLTNSSITLGGGFVGCITNFNIEFNIVNFTDYAGNGMAPIRCGDSCEKNPCGMNGECVRVSERDFSCNCNDSHTGELCDVTISTTVSGMMSSSSSPSPSPSISIITSPTPSSSHVTNSNTFTSTDSATTSPLPTGTTPTGTDEPRLSFLTLADIIGICVAGLVFLCIIALVIVIILLACMLMSHRRGNYRTKEDRLNESTLLRHNTSIRSLNSIRPPNASPKKEVEYYI